MNKHRILLLSHYLGLTGAPMSLLRHAKYLLSAGYDVDVWSIDFFNDNGLESEYISAGLKVKHMSIDDANIASVVEEAKPCYNLVICNTICTYKWVREFQKVGLSTIWFIRETVLADKWAIGNADFCNVLKRFYNIYCPAEYTASQIRFYNKNVRVIRNATPDLFSGYLPPTDVIRYGYIGSIIPVKGVDLLIEAFAALRRQHSNISLQIAGGIESSYARLLMERTRGEQSIKWLGQVHSTDKKIFFDSIDILCIPSLEEPFGLTAAEGAMYGKAVITTDRTGAKCFSEGIDGAIAKAGSVDSLKKAMSIFATINHDELRKCQEKCRSNYLKYGTTDSERNAVLTMVSNNINIPPPQVKKYKFDELLIGHSIIPKALRWIRRLYLNARLKLHGRGAWDAISRGCY